MKKILILLVLLAVAFPFVSKLMPKPMSIERVQAAFENAGHVVDGLNESTASRDAVESWELTVDGYRVEIHRYGDEGKIVKNLGYLQEDVGQAMVESMHIAEQMGAAPNPNLPTVAVRKGMWMVVVVGEDKGICQTLARVFKKS